jgi:UDP-N-acetylglucosamine 4-epimerase
MWLRLKYLPYPQHSSTFKTIIMQLSTPQFEKISNSSFLVTGGAGFIGSHIAEFLLNAGARKVRVLDNLSTGHFRNVAPFANHPAFEFMKGDIRDVDTCKAVCQGMDYVFHQAALGSDPESIKDAVTTNDVNVSGFLNMLVVAQAAGVKRFVYASGFPVYGNNNELHTTEEKVATYTDNKFINELHVGVFSKVYRMETIGLRYFNVFGQRQDPQSAYAAVIPKFVMQLINHESPVIKGTEEYSHDFNYIENVVQANIVAVLTTDPRALNQVYNIAFEERTSLHQLATYLKEFLSVFDKRIADVEIMFDPVPANNADSIAMVEEAKELLGYQPHYSLRNGLLKSVSWYWAYLPQFDLEAQEIKNYQLKMKNEEVDI